MNSIVLAHNDETDVHQSEYLYHFAITALPLEQTSRCMYKDRINKYIWDSTRKIYFLLKRKRKYKSQNKSDSTGSPTYHAYAERNCAIALVACCNVAPNKPHLQLPCKSDLHVCSTSCCGFGIQKDIKACIDANQKIKNNSHQCLQLKNRHLSPSSLLPHRPGQCAYVQWICVMPRSETDCMQSIIHIPCMDIIFICHLYILSICRYQIYLSCTSCIHADQLFYRVSKAAYLVWLAFNSTS